METTGNKRKPSLRKIVAQLGDCICDTLTLGTKKFHGLIRHPDYPELPARRIDIMCTTPEVYPYAILHFTGSGVHNITMSQRANELNYTLNEYGLWHTDKLDKLVNPKIRTEEEIFKELSNGFCLKSLKVVGNPNGLRVLTIDENGVSFLSNIFLTTPIPT